MFFTLIISIAVSNAFGKVSYENYKVFNFIDLTEEQFVFFNALVESDSNVSLSLM